MATVFYYSFSDFQWFPVVSQTYKSIFMLSTMFTALSLVVNPGRTSLGSIECRGLNQKAMQWCTAREQPPKHLDSLTRRKTQFEEMKRVMGACILFGTPFTHPLIYFSILLPPSGDLSVYFRARRLTRPASGRGATIHHPRGLTLPDPRD